MNSSSTAQLATIEYIQGLSGRIKRVRGCWVWQGMKNEKGYAQIAHKRTKQQLHRWMWELVNGRIMPRELYSDHLCRNHSCVNPRHIEPVTPKENSRRGLLSQYREYCKKGLHELNTENSWFNFHKDGRVFRQCHKCRLEYMKRYYQRRLGSANG